MPVVQPQPPRYKIEELGDTLKITLPNQSRWLLRVFMTVWTILFLSVFLINFAAIVLFALRSIEVTGSALFVVLLVPFAVLLFLLGFRGTYSWLWAMTGREIIEANSRIMKIRFQVINSGSAREYAVERISRLRAEPVESGKTSFWIGLFKSSAELNGIVAFDYGKKTIRFGNDIEEAEAKQIIRLIKSFVSPPSRD